jgi:glycosidase
MKYHFNLILLLFFTTSLFSCSGDDNSPDEGGETGGGDTSYEQYGTPFANVPKPQDATIYQVNFRAFSNEGTINAVTAKLDDIKDLGINVVYLMPIYPVGIERSAGGLGSPYSVRNYKEVSSEFGNLNDLRKLVEEAHKRDMAVILDWVANHTSWDNPWITAHKDWYQQDANGNIIIPPGTNYQDVAQLNYNNTDLRKAMIDAMSYWVYNANIDGFRCDYADFVPLTFWTSAINTIRDIKDQDMLLFAEGGRTENFTAGFDYNFGFGFFDNLKEVFSANKSATSIQNKNTEEYQGVSDENSRIVHYTSNHDVNAYNGTPMQLFGGKAGSMATFVVAAYMKSVPMIYNGQEIGYPVQMDFFYKTPIDWSNSDPDMLQQYKNIIAFRNQTDALRNGKLTGYSTNDISVFTRTTATETILVLANLRNKTSKFIVPSSLSGTFENALEGGNLTLENEIVLEPFQYLVLKN